MEHVTLYRPLATPGKRCLFTRSVVWEFLKPDETINLNDVNNRADTCSTHYSCGFHVHSTL